MIDIKDKKQCCGCGACEQRCPKRCISLKTDEQGFLYPYVDQEACVNCHVCEQVCPVLDSAEKKKPVMTYAAMNPDDGIRLKSSSGGVFTALAEYVVKNSGVVFGARFNESWEVVHDYTETIEGIAAFRGSKYVQSVIGDYYVKAEQFLEQGRMVLFSGTPCQIAGLKHYLKKEYERLLTVEVACHGVPSPLIWKEYLSENTEKGAVKELSFREKSNGWKNYNFYICQDHVCHKELFKDNMFMKGFLNDLYLRPACYHCHFKAGRSGADVLLADFWGAGAVRPELDDDKGLSLMFLYSQKGKLILQNLLLEFSEVDYKDVVKYNPAVIKSANPYFNRLFWKSHKEKGLASIEYVLSKKRFLLFKKFHNLWRKAWRKLWN
ncbi:MAG: Coenzyme F420 hydrogenase/dehydrogenase, beta subunit C-terminal domain [Muribaculaceae bacterium]|nr:Coenzyme F420 hydrogenase/dehydrogenase, beta subunit C-terminal domain [Muribaculaceae bacterium]